MEEQRKSHQPRVRKVACAYCPVKNPVNQAPFPARALELLIRIAEKDTTTCMIGKRLALEAGRMHVVEQSREQSSEGRVKEVPIQKISRSLAKESSSMSC